MDDYESLSPTKWDCKYHVVFIPKYRRKVLYGELRQYLGDSRFQIGRGYPIPVSFPVGLNFICPMLNTA
jgi:REP element-mobilizing transposase RayT